ncbi:hypothetical protein [Coleofasciculus sp. E2-BRE-01]
MIAKTAKNNEINTCNSFFIIGSHFRHWSLVIGHWSLVISKRLGYS